MVRAKNKKLYNNMHETEIVLNKQKVKDLLDKKGLEFIEFHEQIVETYGIDLSYKGLMALVDNRSTWKLLYAWAIAEALNVNIKDIFEEKKVNLEKKIKEKEAWKEKYQK